MNSITCNSYEGARNQSGGIDLELEGALDQRPTRTGFLCPAKCPALSGLCACPRSVVTEWVFQGAPSLPLGRSCVCLVYWSALLGVILEPDL